MRPVSTSLFAIALLTGACGFDESSTEAPNTVPAGWTEHRSEAIQAPPAHVYLQHGGGTRPLAPEVSPTADHVTPTETMRVVGDQLVDRCGEPLVVRGVNKDIAGVDLEARAFPEIAKTGANMVRMVWTTAHAPVEADKALSAAWTNGLAVVWELHDATGDFSKLGKVFDYWVQSDTVAMIAKYQTDLIINIANEAGTLQTTDTDYLDTYASGLARMRAAGIHTPILIDAAGWGQNVEQMLRVAPKLMEADPDRNVLFDWHEYTSGKNETGRITNALELAKTNRIPLLVGEFAALGVGDCGQRVPYDHVIGEVARIGTVGYLAWSWDGTNGDCRQNGDSGFDMVKDGVHLSTLASGWARDVVFDLPASIAKTAHKTTWQRTRACE
jgi:mannan endo-1,4-beta-mannosidase